MASAPQTRLTLKVSTRSPVVKRVLTLFDELINQLYERLGFHLFETPRDFFAAIEYLGRVKTPAPPELVRQERDLPPSAEYGVRITIVERPPTTPAPEIFAAIESGFAMRDNPVVSKPCGPAERYFRYARVFTSPEVIEILRRVVPGERRDAGGAP